MLKKQFFSSASPTFANLHAHLRLSRLIHEFETNGHFAAVVDPLALNRNLVHGKMLRSSSLTKEYHGFVDSDLHTYFETVDEPALARFAQKPALLVDILTELETIFSSRLGAEFRHMSNPTKVSWVRKMLLSSSSSSTYPVAVHESRKVLKLLCKAQSFEEFCSSRFSAATHFSLEGGEALIPGLEFLLQHAAVSHGIAGVEMGMAHRGRLNVLRNILHIPLHSLFDRFEGYLADEPGLPNNSDDVRYHLGASVNRLFGDFSLRVNLAANPSHLEAVNGVVLGSARARQFALGSGDGTTLIRDEAKRRIMPLLLHGDASFFQGSVRECLGFSNLRDYSTGGTVHIIINNQIGFTTLPKQAHSSTYCSDVAKSVGAPVFHVNGDSPLDVIRILQSAVDFRQTFLSDVVVNLWCYRRRGHNQKDAPEVTQPLMYRTIASHPPVSSLFAQQSGEELGPFMNEAKHELESKQSPPLSRAQSTREVDSIEDEVKVHWWRKQQQALEDSNSPQQVSSSRNPRTGMSCQKLEKIASSLFTLPVDLPFHAKVRTLFEKRLEQVLDTRRIRWDVAEQLAFASLMVHEGIDIRLSGQDVERGTFNQRHAMLYYNVGETEEFQFAPFSALNKAFPHLSSSATVCNSPLSEESVLAFEHGYSLVNCNKSLTLWEAQFGDFANCCQTIIDTFIASGEEKWTRPSGIVLLLPHGLDGQGPDHSSAFIERFLSLCNESDKNMGLSSNEWDSPMSRQNVNLHVVNPTTPAQYFHLLRRHMLASFRKPLIVFSPKFLLHHKPCSSALEDLDSHFHVILNDSLAATTPKKIVMCSGKIYYHLAEEKERRKLVDVCLLRVEQLCPFPFAALEQTFQSLNLHQTTKLIWAQEEPKNRGAWTWIQPRIQSVLTNSAAFSGVQLEYFGRAASASAATGSYTKHRKELQKLLSEILD